MLLELLEKLDRARVLVVGDIMLDRYWRGAVDRISPEAPVPVVAVSGAEERLGGAANVASNVRALGAQCNLLGITGDDADADALEALLTGQGISAQLERDKSLKTTVKLRIVSQQQQLIRIDFETPANETSTSNLLDRYSKLLAEHDVVIVSDYGKGGLLHVQTMIQLARKANKPVVIDPKGDDYTLYAGATLITPNRKEFQAVAGRYADTDELVRKAESMIGDLGLGGLLVTRSEEGMSLIRSDHKTVHMKARAREVFDVTGAGDTVIAAVGSALAAGSEPEDAIHLANVAAGIVVGKLGSATASPEEIRQELSLEEV
ncbi:MAG: D-glycero-beta-D-manno-heptose-7-phosphate kinase [Acidiferrobacterales bacterium]|nr:D-glycero-beta-D-manno-heptose-7-phosphate kinase [Acidiferrobacterales bacterium]